MPLFDDLQAPPGSTGGRREDRSRPGRPGRARHRRDPRRRLQRRQGRGGAAPLCRDPGRRPGSTTPRCACRASRPRPPRSRRPSSSGTVRNGPRRLENLQRKPRCSAGSAVTGRRGSWRRWRRRGLSGAAAAEARPGGARRPVPRSPGGLQGTARRAFRREIAAYQKEQSEAASHVPGALLQRYDGTRAKRTGWARRRSRRTANAAPATSGSTRASPMPSRRRRRSKYAITAGASSSPRPPPLENGTR